MTYKNCKASIGGSSEGSRGRFAAHKNVQGRSLGRNWDDEKLQEVLRSNDPVRLSWICALLADGKIEGIILDSHTAILEGSGGAIMR
ncbi:MAG: hypothetical protein ACI8S3_002222, partial [Alphaproteobacteria bacterium]